MPPDPPDIRFDGDEDIFVVSSLHPPVQLPLCVEMPQSTWHLVRSRKSATCARCDALRRYDDAAKRPKTPILRELTNQVGTASGVAGAFFFFF